MEIIQPAEFIREYAAAGAGAQFWRAQNVRRGYVRTDGVAYIPWEIFREVENSHVKEGDVLITRTGANAGDCAVVPPGTRDAAVSSHTMRLVPKDVEIGYAVATFFASDYGRQILLRGVSGSSRPQITKQTLQSLMLPDFRDIKADVTQLVRAFYSEQERGAALYSEAESLLVSELELDGIDLSPRVTYTQKFVETSQAGRLDPEYFQPKYYNVEAGIRNGRYPSCQLRRLIQPLRNGYDYREFTAEGTPYVRVGDINRGRIDTDGAVRVPFGVHEVEKDVQLRVGDVLLTRKGTFGKAAVVRQAQEHVIISSEIMLIRLKDDVVRPDYLALFLNSQPGYRQVERRVHGVAYYSISQADLERILIPIPEIPLQRRVGRLVAASIEVEQEASGLLNAAMRRVQDFVLNGKG
jgi:hypothetical protein